MLTVELKDASGRIPVQFDILPTDALPEAVVDQQFDLARQIAPAVGLEYYFLVSRDRTRGWRISDGERVFDASTADLLRPYLEDSDRLGSARAIYLAALVEAWVADLKSGWRSGAGVPGSLELERHGVLDSLRVGPAVSTSGSV